MKNKTHELQKEEKIICPYCDSLTNIYNFSRHKKSKKCQKFKILYLEVNKNTSEAEIEIKINKLKSQLKNSDYFEVEK